MSPLVDQIGKTVQMLMCTVSFPQKPILLQGHERSITQIKYNREGDLLFSVAKDTVSLWLIRFDVLTSDSFLFHI